ncbi:MAG: recombination mediator RecR [Patescibacteria group bacterium]
MYPKSIQKLIEIFSHFPTVGPRVASRFVFYLLKAQDSEIDDFIKALHNLRKEIRPCTFCFNPFDVRDDEQQTGLCAICRDATRDMTLLCIVEKESDLEQLEKTKHYRGRYFLLGKINDILRKEGLQSIKAQELKSRMANEIKEVILALNPTTEGEAGVLYLERLLKPYGKKVTRLGRGLPVGGELEYADDETIRGALEGRR